MERVAYILAIHPPYKGKKLRKLQPKFKTNPTARFRNSREGGRKYKKNRGLPKEVVVLGQRKDCCQGRAFGADGMRVKENWESETQGSLLAVKN